MDFFNPSCIVLYRAFNIEIGNIMVKRGDIGSSPR